MQVIAYGYDLKYKWQVSINCVDWIKKTGGVGVMILTYKIGTESVVDDVTIFFASPNSGNIIVIEKRNGKFYWSCFTEFIIE